MLTPDQWATIRGLVDWLDSENGRSREEITLRLLKLSEEAGEAAQAWIGVTGQNPRKGVTHTPADVADELCDVIVTAAVALASVIDDPAGHLDAKLTTISQRTKTPGTTRPAAPPSSQARPPLHAWRAEIYDGAEWLPYNGAVSDLDLARSLLQSDNEQKPTWADGEPVQRRLVRETVTFTVEDLTQHEETPQP